MNKANRSKLADYVADGIRYAKVETNLEWPNDTIFITKSYLEYADLDSIIGMDVYVMDIDSSYDFTLSFKSLNENKYKLLKAFNEYMKLFKMS